MTDASDDDIIREVEVVFHPRSKVLANLGISLKDFEAALLIADDEREALATLWEGSEDDFPPLEEMPMKIGGVIYRLEDLADIEIRGWDA